jgi:TDG/mug DNA glycosylase family protein
MSYINSFAPIEDSNASILILGSVPSKTSLLARQYYAHSRNSFWPIMGDLIAVAKTLPYTLRIQILKSNGIALWDVLASCTRESSLDSDIDKTSACPNNFESFLLTHQNITDIFFNGAMAEKYFNKLVLHMLKPNLIRYTRLPSTSPAHAALTYNQKLNAWKTILQRKS